MKPSSLLLTAALATGNLFAQNDRWELSETGGGKTIYQETKPEGQEHSIKLP